MRLLVVYGSQTGTAQDIAESIWRTSKSYDFVGPVLALDEFKIENLISEELVLFVVSTTGQGDEPDNMKKFWKFLCRKSLPQSSLQNLHFGVLGLGDSSYVKYNFVAKRLFKRLIQLSAKPILPLGLCDDQHDHGIHATYFSWTKELWNTLNVKVNVEKKSINFFKVNVSEIMNNSSFEDNDLSRLKWPYHDKSEKFILKHNYRATTVDHFQDVRHIKFSYPKNVSWKPFDIIDIRPWNSEEMVNIFFQTLSKNQVSITPNTIVECESCEAEIELPLCYQKTTSVGSLAKYVWDITAVARQKVFELLAINCENETEKEKLIELCTPEGLDDFIKYAVRPKRNILEVLNDFPHATSKITLLILFELFDIIKPRSFSIASCPEEGSLRLLVAVVEYTTILVSKRKGLCSNWLKNLNQKEEILGVIKSGTLRIPNDNSPLILIGPGTGIAPFRSLLIKAEYDLKLLPQNIEKRKIIVFFGCRSRKKDFYFKNDFIRLKQRYVANFFFAFSRDQTNKVYVQHLIKEQEELLQSLILVKSGNIIIAGSSNNMPKQVRETFSEIFGNEKYLEEILVKNGRYQEEVWS